MGLLTMAFWGVMYPQFSLLEETYVLTEGTQDPREDFFSILEGGSGKVVVKSKLWELWEDRSSYVYFGKK